MRKKPGHRALRRGRVSLPGQVYLVTTITAGREPLLAGLQPARAVIGVMRRMQGDGLAHTLAFVVMPDHVHWQFAIGSEVPLSGVVQRFKACSARHVNRLHGRRAAVWQAGFHDRAARRDDNLVAMARYVVMNPVRAGLARRAGDYPFWDCVWLSGEE